MPTQRSEEQLAQKRNEYQQFVFLRRRRRSIFTFFVSIVAASIGWWQSFEFIFFCATATALLAVLFYYDANGHIHELRRRSKKALVPDFSLLDREVQDDQAAPQPSPQAKS